MAPRDVTRDHLAGVTRAALGSGRQLDGVARLAGGTTKGVYRLTMDDGSTVIAYLWAESENFWPQTAHDGDPADQFSSGNSMDLFEASHHRLASLGLRRASPNGTSTRRWNSLISDECRRHMNTGFWHALRDRRLPGRVFRNDVPGAVVTF
jgi:hypothetical protein